MRLRKPGSKPSRRPTASRPAAARKRASKERAQSVLAVAVQMGRELIGIFRELLRIPAALYMRAAERAGEVVLAGWVLLWPVLIAAWRIALRVLAFAERNVTPARAILAVAAVTVAALIGSQFADYRSITVNGSAYTGVVEVATAPEVASAKPTDAHGPAIILIGLVAALLVAGCIGGRWQLARILIPTGVAVIGVSLLVDRPKGLDLGNAEVAYEEAAAQLLAGFWAQLFAGILLVALAPLIVNSMGPADAKRNRRGAKSSSLGKRLGSVRLRRPRLGSATAEGGR